MTFPDTDPEDEKLIDELMAKRDSTRKVTSLHDVWLAGYLCGQDPDGRMGDNPYPARVAPPADEVAGLRAGLADWHLIKDEPVVQGRLAVIKAAASAPKPKRMISVGRFPITPVESTDDRVAAAMLPEPCEHGYIGCKRFHLKGKR